MSGGAHAPSSRGRAPWPAPRTATTPITSAVDELAHDVEDSEVLSGRPHGRYIAMCGAAVVPASLTAPDGRSCRSCAALRCIELTEPEKDRPARSARRAQSRWLATCSAIMRGTLHRRAVAWS